ncbi:unnamed protein product [Arctia plantaginis]|uniref:Uncharacterized protein n=1 Tax=Arctia plantaginis TaxID=874455 RepID=A0A8S1APD5_ARCPL|nr:unnamed protein product [Arctia plantaginis]
MALTVLRYIVRYTRASISPARRRPVATGLLSVQRFLLRALNVRYVIKILLVIFEVQGFNIKQLNPDTQKCQMIQMMVRRGKKGRLGCGR